MLWSAFLLGLLGSLHCVGMCGPIALALPSKDPIQLLIYNLGRTTTYAILGSLMGAIGLIIPIAGLQQWLSITAGALILLYILFLLFNRRMPMNSWFSRLNSRFIRMFKSLFAGHSKITNLLIGLANGLLPCGLVYMGLVGALAQGTAHEGAFYMALFGIGTIPVMLVVSLTGRYMGNKSRVLINKMIPTFLFVIAILFILRGMNLGIPYVSPKLTDGSTPEVVECKQE